MISQLTTLVNVKKRMLKTNVQTYLARNHDWKISRAVTTGVPLSQADIIFRNNIITEYNNRMTALGNATTLAEAQNVSLSFP